MRSALLVLLLQFSSFRIASAFLPAASPSISIVPPSPSANLQPVGARAVVGRVGRSAPNRRASSTALSAVKLSAPAIKTSAIGLGLAAIGGFLRRNPQIAAILTIDAVAVGKFYKGYPLVAGFTTAACKASVADRLAQYRDVCVTKFDGKRNLAMMLYSGTTLGLGCEVMYNRIFPLMFGPAGAELDVVRVMKMTLFDGFVNAPLLWLWPAYIAQALVYQYPKRDAIKKYASDVKNNGLLKKYWSLWLPVTSFNFCFVPPHFRVAFVAAVSFFWMIVLSMVANKSDEDGESCPVEPEPVMKNPRALD